MCMEDKRLLKHGRMVSVSSFNLPLETNELRGILDKIRCHSRDLRKTSGFFFKTSKKTPTNFVTLFFMITSRVALIFF